MTKRDDGGPAYPRDDVLGQSGMSLRQWYAGMALPIARKLANSEGLLADHEIRPDDIANAAFQIADAMLAQRSKP